MRNSGEVWEIVEAKRDAFFELSDRIWEMPETNYEEYRSSEEHAHLLEKEGFRVTRGIANLPTAVMGEAGEGGPIIAILGEFDALPASARLQDWPKSGQWSKAEMAMAVATIFSGRDRCWRQLRSRTIW